MLIGFLIGLVIAAVVIYVLYVVLGMINIPEPIKNIIYVIIGLVLILWVLNYFGIYHSDLGTIPTH